MIDDRFLPLPLDESDARGRVYRQLVSDSGISTEALAAKLGLDLPSVRTHLAALARTGLIMRVSVGQPTRWEALQPATVMRDELARREARLVEDRRRVQELTDLYRAARGAGAGAPAVELLQSPEQINGHFIKLQRDAVGQIRAMDRPPYLSPMHPAWGKQQVDMQTERMAAGVCYRVVYQRTVFENAPLAAISHSHISQGELAREHRSLPMKLTIMDDTRALISLEPYGSATDPSALLVHQSALLVALGDVFETFWRAAEPVGVSRGGLTQRQSDVLQLMADGVADDAIARLLHVSTRTVTRTIADLHDQLGATTRFQVGLHAAVRGYLNTSHLD